MTFGEYRPSLAGLVARSRDKMPESPSNQEFNNYLRIDLLRRRVWLNRGGQWQETHLAPKEFAILDLLVRSQGMPVGKRRIMDAANVEEEGSLQTHIWKLRQKLEPDPRNPLYILTYHKVGYRFQAP